ncbi:DUF5709 domain-containing protein [Microlunatus sp. Gsoil 973]|uniref:DUF5709 domain-containing protein n=1 Tax=Microlunatus sp. Gsoil 973 TaxID=2672569 RepID=UPI0012B46982|nr:DUF5709 domain-containing protein [Microlunatus sp. Gsoil 973]QGN31772.1 hypothetical protein GJV80_01890 [Microlunatus sp. Gsoil 973]
MTDRELDPSEYDEVPDESEQLDQDPFQPDYGLEDRGVDDALDEGLTTPENWSVLERRGEHETLDERLAEEVPDTGDDQPGADQPAEADEFSDFVDDGEVGRERAGRLVDPNEGIGTDEESELIGEDVGIDGAAASAEEAAVHVVDSPDEGDDPADERG